MYPYFFVFVVRNLTSPKTYVEDKSLLFSLWLFCTMLVRNDVIKLEGRGQYSTLMEKEAGYSHYILTYPLFN